MTKCMLATGSGSAVNLWPSPTGGEGLLNVQSLARTVFWFKDKENGKQRTVRRADLTIICAPGNSKCNWSYRCPLGISYLFISRICAHGSVENRVSWLTGTFFFFFFNHSVWRILSSKEETQLNSSRKIDKWMLLIGRDKIFVSQYLPK